MWGMRWLPTTFDIRCFTPPRIRDESRIYVLIGWTLCFTPPRRRDESRLYVLIGWTLCFTPPRIRDESIVTKS